MKKISILSGLLFTAVFALAQSQEGTVAYQNKQLPAAVMELPYAPSVVNSAMNDYLSKKGRSKSSDIKGFTTYRNTQPLQEDSVNADLYFKTERKSRKEKEVTVISLLLRPDEVQTGNSSLHYLGMEDAKRYLNDLSTAISAYDVEQNIKDQNAAVQKAESKYKSLTSEGDDLEKKRAALDRKIADNKADQQQQLKEIENQKQKLSEWVGQRKS